MKYVVMMSVLSSLALAQPLARPAAFSLTLEKSNASLGPANVPLSCSIYPDKLLVTKKFGKDVSVTTEVKITQQGLQALVKDANVKTEVKKHEKMLVGGGITTYSATLLLPQDGLEKIVLSDSNAQQTETNPSAAAKTLIRIIDEYCK